jgi:hypothetical protein
VNPIVYHVPIPNIISGGVQIICKHVEYLNEMGITAFAHFDNNIIPRWFEHTTPAVGEKEIANFNNYTVVIPEIVPEKIFRYKNSKRKILFAQNWKMMETNMSRIQKSSYKELGYTDVMTCGPAMTSEAIATGYTNGLKTYTVTNAASLLDEVTHNCFDKVPNSILLLSRRNPNHVNALCELLNKQELSLNISVLDKVSQEELFEEFKKTDIYIHTGDNEGLPRPPMEAMLRGCAVVGYDGRGGRDFMIDGETALVANNGSLEDLKNKVITILINTPLREKIRQNGFEYLKNNFTLSRMKSELLQVYVTQ